MLRQVANGYAYPLPVKLVQSFARSWESNKRSYVLLDEVEDWLVENEIAAEVCYTIHNYEYEPIDYLIVFLAFSDALAFILRWA